jgi:HEXXH motif-containing protein
MAELQNRVKEASSGADFHQLAPADLMALAGSHYTESLIRRLRAAELSKNVLLLEAVRREAIRIGSDGVSAIIDSACEVLRTAQASRPGVVARLLTLPNFGLWAVESLTRLRTRTQQPGRQLDVTVLKADVGHLATFAAVAALRTQQHCQLKLPIRDGVIHLPTLGRVTVPAGSSPNWADFVSDSRGATIASGSWKLHLPAAGSPSSRGAMIDWTSAHNVAAKSHGLAIRLSLEDSDPFLSQLVPAPYAISPELVKEWQQRLTGAWELLTHYHRNIALGLSRALTVIVPSAELERGQPVTATSGWAWGAVLLSLPSDKISFAEALTHEFHHLVLAAVEDITTLINSAAHDDLCYAPWRDDPRPRSALLQGSYAFFGVAGFWLRQSRAGSSADKQRAEIEFARRSQNVSDALAELRNWAGLTAAGHLFISKMADQLAKMLAEPVHPSARATARQVNSEHRARWLRTHEIREAQS